jgi:hypothetical protein
MINFGSGGPLLVEFARAELGDSIWQNTTDHLVLMQTTGHEDKHEREVFEGDIVRTEQGGLWEVFWSKSDMGFYARRRFDDLVIPFGPLDRSEVIGNIHENPDLLPSAA